MKYRVAFVRSEEGYAVWVPALPGCCSQGDSEAEALENIADAIKDWLAVREESRTADIDTQVQYRDVEIESEIAA
ncbi:MAG: type II toxin-antitoxin system HicB family antitoxin [Planctomycetota bacterium]|nr:type II toxin-antitoxin system HicB family antitoxin [Planctomycetaceae bacterium]MDQ3329430.1 type II toxin-antitoxin system HicB family antitoxin [Planctomycetota bacterium]